MTVIEAKELSSAEFANLRLFRAEAEAEWGGLAVHAVEQSAAFCERLTFADHVVQVRISGSCRLRQEVEGRSRAGRSIPGSVHVIPAHLHARWDASAPSGSSRSVAMFIPHDAVARVAGEAGIDPKGVEIVPQFLIHDGVIESLLTRLLLEVRDGLPSGRLYAESACNFLVHHVVHAYSATVKPRAHATGGLSPARLRAVLEFIEEQIAGPIALRQLADLANVSPRHFQRAFRQAVGSPPHAYVIAKRVAAARSLLLSEPALPVEHVATRVGFSNSSHLALAFRRVVGCSPAAFRRSHSRFGRT